MPRCNHCGKTNREGSIFCQECGQRLDVVVQPEAPPDGSQVICRACGAPNPAGMNFCRMCGTGLTASATPGAAKQKCSACEGMTPAGFAFCQNCGGRLLVAEVETSKTLISPTPAAGLPRP